MHAMIFFAVMMRRNGVQLIFQLLGLAWLGLFIRPAVQNLPCIVVHHRVYIQSFLADRGEGLKHESVVPSEIQQEMCVSTLLTRTREVRYSFPSALKIRNESFSDARHCELQEGQGACYLPENVIAIIKLISLFD
jgi:hypothetical protein